MTHHQGGNESVSTTRECFLKKKTTAISFSYGPELANVRPRE